MRKTAAIAMALLSRRFLCFLAATIGCVPIGQRGVGADTAADRIEFGVMANSVDMRRLAPAELASLIKQLGYCSVALTGSAEHLGLTVAAYRQKGLRVGAVYVGWTTDGKTVACSPNVEEVFAALRRTRAVVMLHVHEAKGASVSDERIAELLRPLAERAAKEQVELAIYPHTGFRLATIEQAVAIADLVEHPSLGVCFNLCHYLRQHEERGWPEALRLARPWLKLVSINGADSGNTRAMGWKQLIQPLDEGSFDTRRLVRFLCEELSYRGPVFVQCYNVRTPARELLQRTLAKWRAIMSDIDEGR